MIVHDNEFRFGDAGAAIAAPKKDAGGAGILLGAGLGLAVGGPVGAVVGAVLGAGLGGEKVVVVAAPPGGGGGGSAPSDPSAAAAAAKALGEAAAAAAAAKAAASSIAAVLGVSVATVLAVGGAAIAGGALGYAVARWGLNLRWLPSDIQFLTPPCGYNIIQWQYNKEMYIYWLKHGSEEHPDVFGASWVLCHALPNPFKPEHFKWLPTGPNEEARAQHMNALADKYRRAANWDPWTSYHYAYRLVHAKLNQFRLDRIEEARQYMVDHTIGAGSWDQRHARYNTWASQGYPPNAIVMDWFRSPGWTDTWTRADRERTLKAIIGKAHVVTGEQIALEQAYTAKRPLSDVTYGLTFTNPHAGLRPADFMLPVIRGGFLYTANCFSSGVWCDDNQWKNGWWVAGPIYTPGHMDPLETFKTYAPRPNFHYCVHGGPCP